MFLSSLRNGTEEGWCVALPSYCFDCQFHIRYDVRPPFLQLFFLVRYGYDVLAFRRPAFLALLLEIPMF